MSVSHIIADLHLSEERPDITEGFLLYLQKVASEADHLYILGDFFEVWVGDDYTDPTIDRVAEALSLRSQQGLNTYFCHGNRDFLLGQQFCARAGMHLLAEETLVQLAGQTALLMHGDSLCIDDKEYQSFRKMVREAHWQQEFLQQPLIARLAIAKQLRNQSKKASREKAQDIMDVNPLAVKDTCQRFAVNVLVHGHTHRPADHQDGNIRRLVVGDWDQHMHFVKADSTGLSLIKWQWN